MRYLLLTYYTKPSGKIDEVMTISKRLRSKDWQMTNVILDFKTLQVEKCHMGGVQVPKNFHRIVEYYMQHYESIIKRLFDENGYEIVKNEETKSESEVQPNANNPS